MAAISIAKRIAEEYDGLSVGENVGYRVGGKNNVVEGREIMLMTDAALVKMSMEDKLLSSIKVSMYVSITSNLPISYAITTS
jgi:HrpA-like RNA helicase